MLEAPSTVVDVLIPVYNVEVTVAEAIGSILNQSFRELRAIVVDDGSTDRTATILADMAARDARLVVISKPNGGIVSALNAGLAHCTADFVARHDGDDIAAPERIAVELDYLRSHPDCVAVSAEARHIDLAGKSTGTRSHMARATPPDPEWVPSHEPGLLHPFLMMRRDAVEKAGGYRYVFHSEDIDLYWRLMRYGRLHVLDRILGDYRIHPQSIMSQSIVNGRIAALNAQLAAISEMRRRRGEPDIEFREEAIAEYRRLGRLEAMVQAASRMLTEAEARYLALATAMKLLDLTNYRPYELDEDDARFIRRTIDGNRHILSPANAKSVRDMQMWTLIRLLSRRRFGLLRMVTPPRVYAPTASLLVGNRLRRLTQRLRRSPKPG